jgi:hypothetical protein
VGFVTADRPASLTRALQSFIHHCHLHAQWPRFLIVDGSRQRASRTATRAAVATIARATGRDLQYVATEEADAFCASLRQDDASAPALVPGTAGQNRNLMLLMTAGERVLFVDDDMVYDTWEPHERRAGLVVMGHDEIREVAFHPSRAAALAAVAPAPQDLLGSHAALLGRSLSDLLAASSEPPDLTRACEHLRSRLRSGRPQVVRATFSGLVGDSGTYCPGRLLFSSGSFRARLWESEASFRTAMTSREVSRIAAANVVTHTCHCASGGMGLSNLTVVPPFPPLGRNQDGVFGVLLAMSDPAALFAHVPVGIVHDSDRSSRYGISPLAKAAAGQPVGDGARWRSAAESRLSELVIALLLRQAPSLVAASPADRLREIGEALTAVGRLEHRAFVTLVTDVTRETRARELEYAETGAESPDCPTYWRSALEDYRRTLQAAMCRPEFFLPIEFQDRGSLESGYRPLRSFMRSLGCFVADWPAWWEAGHGSRPERSPL